MPASSMREQILARLAALLLNTTPAGASVSRSREIGITRAQTPAIVIVPASTEGTRLATAVDRNHLDVNIEIFTRGDPWDSLADQVDVPAHRLIMADAQLRALVSDIRRTGDSFESLEADRTAGTLTVQYRITFLASATDISVAG